MNVQIEESWKKALQAEFEKPYFTSLAERLHREKAEGNTENGSSEEPTEETEEVFEEEDSQDTNDAE